MTWRSFGDPPPDRVAQYAQGEEFIAAVEKALTWQLQFHRGLEAGNGEFNTDPKKIAEHLAQHWGKTFRRTPINKQLLQQWLTSLPQLTPQRYRNK